MSVPVRRLRCVADMLRLSGKRESVYPWVCTGGKLLVVLSYNAMFTGKVVVLADVDGAKQFSNETSPLCSRRQAFK
jgi:hypothetical protein